MKKFWNEAMGAHEIKIGVKVGGAFSPAVGWGGGMELLCQSCLMVRTNFGFSVFSVTGNVSRDMTLHDGTVSAKAPTDERCQASRRCRGRRLAKWMATHVHGIAAEHPGLKIAQRQPPHGYSARRTCHACARNG